MPTVQVRLDPDVIKHIESQQRPRESYNAALRRILRLDKKQRKEAK